MTHMTKRKNSGALSSLWLTTPDLAYSVEGGPIPWLRWGHPSGMFEASGLRNNLPTPECPSYALICKDVILSSCDRHLGVPILSYTLVWMKLLLVRVLRWPRGCNVFVTTIDVALFGIHPRFKMWLCWPILRLISYILSTSSLRSQL
jgi:hypothetical protein